MAWNVTVDHDKCTGDGECVDVCPVEVYELQDGKAVPVVGSAAGATVMTVAAASLTGDTGDTGTCTGA